MDVFAATDDDVKRLREALQAADYTTATVRDVLGDEGFAALLRDDLPRVLRATGGGSQLETLIRLLFAGTSVDATAAAAALPTASLDDWVGIGLLVRDGDTVAAPVLIRPYDVNDRPAWIAHDRLPRSGPAPADIVMGIGPASTTLVNATIRRPVATTLDLGTGCGIQALHAATHSNHVVALTAVRARLLARRSP